MSFGEMLRRTLSEWMKPDGPEADIALSSRIRLARNLPRIPFPRFAAKSQLEEVLNAVERVTAKSDVVGHLDFIRLGNLSPLERAVLVEKHLISPQHAEDPEYKAVALRNDEIISVMVNEEDHLRIQVLQPGLSLDKAWELANKVDDFYESELDFAFSETRGYLTACPTNVGTGMRASAMLHLPALVMTDQMKRVIAASSQIGLAVRGFYGEGTEAIGNMFQISNQVTLGHSEGEIIRHLTAAARQIIEQERNARAALFHDVRLPLEDRIYRAYGLLSNARNLTSEEAMRLLSDVRLGVDLGLIKEIGIPLLNELLVAIRPASLQKLVGGSLTPEARDVQRAALIREKIRSTQQKTS